MLAIAAALLWTRTAIAAFPQQACVDEPVFDGKVCVYEANREAAHSVVLVHGINGSAHDWRRQIPALARTHHVLAFDLPGFGESSNVPQKPYTPDNYARLLAKLVARYVTGPFTLVGHSMGSVVALRYVGRYLDNDHLNGLVLIDSAGVLHGLALSKLMAGAWAERLGAGEFVARMTGKVLEEIERLPLDLLGSEAGLRDESAQTAAIAVSQTDLSLDIASVAVPTLILWGEEDKVAPLRTAHVLHDQIDGSGLMVLPGSGHVPMRDQPERVNALLEAFLGGEPIGDRKARQLPPATESPRIGMCENDSGRLFTGQYERIELRHCDHIVIRDARVGGIDAFESRLQIMDSEIVTGGTALAVEGSEVEITASELVGAVAITASRSRLDLAGVRLVGHRAAVVSRKNSKLIFSVSHVTSPYTDGHVHGFHALEQDRM